MSGHKIFEKVSSLPTAKVHLSVDELHLFIVYTCIHTFHSTSKEQQQQIKSFAIIMQTRTTALAPWMYADTLWVYRHSITSIPAIATATTTKPFPSQLNFQTKTPALGRSRPHHYFGEMVDKRHHPAVSPTKIVNTGVDVVEGANRWGSAILRLGYTALTCHVVRKNMLYSVSVSNFRWFSLFSLRTYHTHPLYETFPRIDFVLKSRSN